MVPISLLSAPMARTGLRASTRLLPMPRGVSKSSPKRVNARAAGSRAAPLPEMLDGIVSGELSPP
jgi:hypothetical protein